MTFVWKLHHNHINFVFISLQHVRVVYKTLGMLQDNLG